MLKLRDIAENFRTNVEGFAELTGYTKPALYNLFAGRRQSCSEKRLKAVMKSLQSKSDDLYYEDLARAKLEKQEREKYINKMCRHAGIQEIIENR